MPRGRKAATLMGAVAATEALVVGFGTAASAGTAAGYRAYFYDSGIKFWTNAYISTWVDINPENHQAVAGTAVWADSSVPSGFMGVQNIAFKNGGVVNSTGWAYNDSTYGPNQEILQDQYYQNQPSGSIWYSAGYARGFNGHGYDTWITPRSPTQAA